MTDWVKVTEALHTIQRNDRRRLIRRMLFSFFGLWLPIGTTAILYSTQLLQRMGLIVLLLVAAANVVGYFEGNQWVDSWILGRKQSALRLALVALQSASESLTQLDPQGERHNAKLLDVAIKKVRREWIG